MIFTASSRALFVLAQCLIYNARKEDIRAGNSISPEPGDIIEVYPKRPYLVMYRPKIHSLFIARVHSVSASKYHDGGYYSKIQSLEPLNVENWPPGGLISSVHIDFDFKIIEPSIPSSMTFDVSFPVRVLS